VLQCVNYPSTLLKYVKSVAVCCSVWQYVAVFPILLQLARVSFKCGRELQCVAVCCGVLLCVNYPSNLLKYVKSVAVCCSVWQCVAVCCSVVQCGSVSDSPPICPSMSNGCSVLQAHIFTSARLRVLQLVAVCCSGLQSVAVCCSGLQSVAVCCIPVLRKHVYVSCVCVCVCSCE